MSEPEVSLLQRCVEQRDSYVAQGNMLLAQFQQTQGAVVACNEMIKKMEGEALTNVVEKDQEKLPKKASKK